MRRSFYTISILIGFLLGVLTYLVWQPDFLVLLLSALLLSLLCVWKRGGWQLYISLFLIAFLFGVFRGSMTERTISSGQVDFYNGKTVELEGWVRQVDERREKIKYTVSIEVPIEGPMDRESVNGDVLLTLNKYPRLDYGDRVKILGELQAPGKFNGFSYDQYLSRYGIYSVMYYPRVEKVGEGEGNTFWKAMTFLQNTFLKRINELWPEPHASFEAGLLVGARKGIPPDLMEKFNITGLTHIIAISGYNIAIIIVFVMWLLKSLPRRIQFWVAIISIVLFTLFVGASPAVVRASIMGILSLLALQSGRQNNIHITILVTAFLMVLWNPKILWWDVGFQLSFAAVLGLIYIAPHFDKYSKKLPQAFGIREAIQMTMAAQVTALPIIVYNFERLSLIAPIANLLVAFAIPPAMLFGFMSVVTSFLFYPISLIFGFITYGILSYIIKIIELMAAVPYASIDLPGMKLWMLFGYYALLISSLYWASTFRKDSSS